MQVQLGTGARMERRHGKRRAVHLPVEAAQVAERRLPAASSIDVSEHGLLVAFSEPIGPPVGSRMLVSIDPGGGRLHLLTTVKRVARGADFRTYVALELDTDESGSADERWRAWVASLPERVTESV